METKRLVFCAGLISLECEFKHEFNTVKSNDFVFSRIKKLVHLEMYAYLRALKTKTLNRSSFQFDTFDL